MLATSTNRHKTWGRYNHSILVLRWYTKLCRRDHSTERTMHRWGPCSSNGEQVGASDRVATGSSGEKRGRREERIRGARVRELGVDAKKNPKAFLQQYENSCCFLLYIQINVVVSERMATIQKRVGACEPSTLACASLHRIEGSELGAPTCRRWAA